MPDYEFATWLYEQRYLHRNIRESLVKLIWPGFRDGHEFSTDFYGLKWTGWSDNYVDYQVLLRGAYEKFMLHFMRDALIATGKDKVVLDIGANIGNHALFLSRYSSTVHAFEPYEPARSPLEKKISINNVDNVVVYPIGLSDKKESIPYYPMEAGGTGSFEKDFFQGEDENKIILNVDVGDNVVVANNISGIDLIKIDVEGFEIQVLTGLKNTMEENRPLVIFETLHDTRESSATDFDKMSEMFPAKYVFYIFSKRDKKRGRYSLVKIKDVTSLKSNDIIACPEEKAELLKTSN
jgi:FkbM family methyltransferase